MLHLYVNNTSVDPTGIGSHTGFTYVDSVTDGNSNECVQSSSYVCMATGSTITVELTSTPNRYIFSAYQA